MISTPSRGPQPTSYRRVYLRIQATYLSQYIVKRTTEPYILPFPLFSSFLKLHTPLCLSSFPLFSPFLKLNTDCTFPYVLHFPIVSPFLEQNASLFLHPSFLPCLSISGVKTPLFVAFFLSPLSLHCWSENPTFPYILPFPLASPTPSRLGPEWDLPAGRRVQLKRHLFAVSWQLLCLSSVSILNPNGFDLFNFEKSRRNIFDVLTPHALCSTNSLTTHSF